MDKFLCLFLTFYCVSSTSSLYAERPNRILYGLLATENQFPYMISLQQLSQIHTATRGHKCGGALVTLQHAVTSANSILEYDQFGPPPGMRPINPAEYRVFAGSVFLSNDTSADRIRAIARVTLHPEFDLIGIWQNNRFKNDIAIITLATPFSGNTVARLSITDIGVDPIMCTFSGWGRNTQLLYAPMTAINETRCRRYLNSVLTSSMVCASDETPGQEAKPTSGDDGGPLVCHGSLLGILIDFNHWRIPDMYTRVANFTTWIDHVVAQPLPGLGNESSTQTTPTTSPVTLPGTSPTPAPSGASSVQPGMRVLAVVAIAQFITANVSSKFFKTMGY